jgi:hypothetical protein
LLAGFFSFVSFGELCFALDSFPGESFFSVVEEAAAGDESDVSLSFALAFPA